MKFNDPRCCEKVMNQYFDDLPLVTETIPVMTYKAEYKLQQNTLTKITGMYSYCCGLYSGNTLESSIYNKFFRKCESRIDICNWLATYGYQDHKEYMYKVCCATNNEFRKLHRDGICCSDETLND